MIPMVYALVTSIATLSGGILLWYTRLRLIEQRYLAALASGAMAAIALFELIPGMKPHNAWAFLLGFFSIYRLEKLVLIHACHKAECKTHLIGRGALIGIATESLIGGLAGVFLHVGASDLLPEVQRCFNRSVVLATLTGAALIPALGNVLGL